MSDDEDSESEPDLGQPNEQEPQSMSVRGFVWQPVCVDPSSEDFERSAAEDPSVKELDLANISERSIFVRKANLKDF